MMKKVFLTGDIHGNPSRLSSSNWPEGKELTKDDVVIILGDFGLIWSELRTKEESYWLKWLDDKPFTTCFIDGNHEAFSVLNKLPRMEKFGGVVGIAGHSVFHLRRSQVLKINDLKLLALGGAHSHDRDYRSWGESMWIEEEITSRDIEVAQNELKIANWKVDYVLTHCAPVSKARGAMPQNAAHLWTPDHSEERLQILHDSSMEYKRWFCGHYHTDFGPTYDEKFECIYEKIVELS